MPSHSMPSSASFSRIARPICGGLAEMKYTKAARCSRRALVFNARMRATTPGSSTLSSARSNGTRIIFRRLSKSLLR